METSNDTLHHTVLASGLSVVNSLYNADMEITPKAQSEESVAEYTKDSPTIHIQRTSNRKYDITLQGVQVHQSEFYNAAHNVAQVPFLDHQLLECDYYGLVYTNENHDITLRVPEGAVEFGKKIHFEFAVAMYGPFDFPENSQPISPILWLCILEEDVKLMKSFLVIFPHYLTGLTNEIVHLHHIGFAKASHDDYTWKDEQMSYQFQLCRNIKPLFAGSGNKGYGVLISKHCCFYCLLGKKTPKLAMDAGYMLIRIESVLTPQQYEIYFCAIFCLDTCYQDLKEQYPEEDGYRISYCREFKFKSAETDPHIKMVVDHDQQLRGAILIGLQPTTAMIRLSEINFWQEANINIEKMRLRHNLRVYPPRIQMTLRMKSMDDLKVFVTFEGCSSDSQLSVEIALPIVTRDSLPSSPSSLSSNTVSPQSHKILCDKQLSTIFRELSSIADKWKNIGLLLGVQHHKLNVISANQSGVYNCLQEMLYEWLRQITLPTWEDLAKAVEVFDPKKAEDIRRRSVEPQYYVLETEV